MKMPRYTCCREVRKFSSVQFRSGVIGFTASPKEKKTSRLRQTANGKRQAEISRLPKTREIYLVSVYILPVSHSYGASTKNREIS